MLAVIGEYMPDGGETTATALLMATSNLAAGFLARFAGAAILDTLGIERGNYTNLPWAILIRSLVRFLPIPFIPLLVPSGSSYDKTRYNADDLPPSKGENEEADERPAKTPPRGEAAAEEGEDKSASIVEGHRVVPFFNIFRSASRLLIKLTDSLVLSTELSTSDKDAEGTRPEK